jgi:pseudouridine kinase
VSEIPGGPGVVLIGSACCDVRGLVGACFGAGTVNDGRVRLSLGGTARNIAENLARLDVPSRLLTAVGDDVPGRQILYYTRAAGVILDNESLLVHQGRASGAYLAIERDDGELALAIDDTTITRTITPRIIHRWRRFLRDAALVVADATLRPQTLATIARLCRQAGVDLCFEPVSVALAPRIAPFIADATLLTPNMREAAVLAGMPVTNREEAFLAARALQERGAGTVIITMAGAGAVYASAEVSGHVPAMQTEAVDGAGAGDALTAGVIVGMLNNFPLDEAVTLGTAMASLTMLTSEKVRADLSLERVYAHMQV